MIQSDLTRRLDPVTTEVLRNALPAIADEMSVNLRRTAYNMMIYEVRDYCCALLDPQGRLIAQNVGGVSHFVADLGVIIKDGVRRYGTGGFSPGDVLVSNHQRVAGQHLNNVCVYTPFFFEDELCGFAIVRAHWVDVGGQSTGFGASESVPDPWAEGLQLDQLKIYERGLPNEPLLRMICDNIRFPESTMGDMRGQLAACRLAERHLKELFERYGAETIRATIDEIFDQTESRCRLVVAGLPDGVYEAESIYDDDGVERDKPVPVKVRVIVAGSDMTIDLTGCSLERKGGINGRTLAAPYIAYKAFTQPLDPVNEGSFRALTVDIQEGNFMMARFPAPMAGWSRVLSTVVDTIVKALARAIPERAPAAHFGLIGHSFSFVGRDAASGQNFLMQTAEGGGWGGRPGVDGASASVSICQGDVRNSPIETIELRAPVRVESRALRADSGGAGEFRGGLGMDIRMRNLIDGSWTLSNRGRRRQPPWGLFGGGDGATSECFVNVAGETEVRREDPVRKVLPAGSVVTLRSAGGGGWGDPYARDPGHVLADVTEGLVSLEAAARDYGVVIDAKKMIVDEDATRAHREQHGRTRSNEVEPMQMMTGPVEAELAQKVERVQDALRAAGVGTLAIYYGGQHNASRLDPVFWLTDVRVLGPAMLLVPASGRPRLVLSQAWDTERARESGTNAEITASNRHDLVRDAVRSLKELAAPLAFSGRAVMPIDVYEEFHTELKSELRGGEDIIPALAAVRVPYEVARVERAAQIADDGFRALCEIARVGMREYELAAEVDAAMLAAGAEDDFGLIGAGASSIAIRPPTDRRLEPGDVIIGEITPCYRGYLAQLCRTFILGEPNADHVRVYDLLMASEHAGLAAARPGNQTSQIAKDINSVIAAAGYQEYCKPPYMRSRGHGLGTGGVAPLDINESTTLALERNMTMVIHPNQFVPETGYLMCGDMVVIEGDGPRVLTQTPLRLFSSGQR